jgi:hypothetical protein
MMTGKVKRRREGQGRKKGRKEGWAEGSKPVRIDPQIGKVQSVV